MPLDGALGYLEPIDVWPNTDATSRFTCQYDFIGVGKAEHVECSQHTSTIWWPEKK